MNSRAKGKRGELALVRRLKDLGYNVRRGQQYCGANGDADIVGIPGVHVECKWVEHLNVRDAMDQSIRDAKPGEIPHVFHKRNGTDWLVTLTIDGWDKLMKGEL